MAAASSAFGLYVGRFAAYSALYGPLATLIGLMMWFYISAYVVLFGAEVNAALDREWRHYKLHQASQEAKGRADGRAMTGKPPAPHDLAEIAALAPEAVCTRLGAMPEGLSSAEVAARPKRFGPNRIAARNA